MRTMHINYPSFIMRVGTVFPGISDRWVIQKGGYLSIRGETVLWGNRDLHGAK